MKNQDKIIKWLNEELTDSELIESVGIEEFEKITRLTKAANNFKAPEYDTDFELRKLTNKLHHPKKRVSLFQKISPAIRIAAIFIIVLATGYFIYNQLNTVADNSQWITDQTEIYLPDSSFVALNTDSKLRFSTTNWEEARDVELQGEAFFKVKKGSKFHVKTNQGTVTVLGTEFGIKDRKSYYEVTCYSGLVSVVTNKDSVILRPQSVFRVINDKTENYTIANKAEPDWINGESSFKSVPLKYVLDELERQYKVTVKTQNVDLNQIFTGGFPNQNIEIALENITFPVNLNYVFNKNKNVITLESK